MKKTIYLIAVMSVLILLSACSLSPSDESSANQIATLEPANQPAAVDSDVVETPMVVSTEHSGKAASDAASSEEMASSKEMASTKEMATSESMMEEPTVMADESMAVNRPAWQQVALTNARTGETFSLADFEGKTVFVEPMATWCTNCRQQLTNVRNAKLQLNNENVVFVALSVETNIDDGELAQYANGQGFDWLFAVTTPEMLRLLADEFGQSITNPPATPHFIIRPDGTFTDLVTGIDSVEQVTAQITAVQG